MQPLVEAAGLTSPPRAPVLVALNKIGPSRARSVECDAKTLVPKTVWYSSRLLTGDGDSESSWPSRAKHSGKSVPLSRKTRSAPSRCRFFVAELVRETVLEQLQDEMPYCVACGSRSFANELSDEESD